MYVTYNLYIISLYNTQYEKSIHQGSCAKHLKHNTNITTHGLFERCLPIRKPSTLRLDLF